MRWIDGLLLLSLGPTVAMAQQTPPAPASAAPPSPAVTVQTSQMPAVPVAPRANVAPRFLVVLDAAHGGSDTGAKFRDGLLEKDITLSLSVRLRSTLSAH